MKITLSSFVGRKQLPGDEAAFSRLASAFGPALPLAKKPIQLNTQRRDRAVKDALLTIAI